LVNLLFSLFCFIVVQPLVLLGVGTIVAVDDDLIDETNRHRLIGARPNHVKKKLSKTANMTMAQSI